MNGKSVIQIKFLLIVFFSMALFRLSAQELYNLVMEQRPESLSDIKYNNGSMFSVRWEAVDFSVYAAPDTSSQLLFEKKGKLLYKKGIPWCEFRANLKNNCFKYLVSSDSSDLPISHSLEFSDVREEKGITMWYRIVLDGVTGWTSTPFAYSSSDPYPMAARAYLTSNAFIRWIPADPDAILHADVGRQTDRSLKGLLTENRRLEVADEIRWVGDSPILTVHVVNKLEDFAWCTQRELPKRVASGLMYMFGSDKMISIIQMPEIDCD